MKKLYIDKQINSTKVALAENGDMVEYHIERINSQKMVGNIYKGKVVKIHPAMEVAFVKISDDKNAFLYIGENIDDTSPLSGVAKDKSRPNRFKISEGDIIMCQVVKDEFGKKGARLTLDVTLPGRLLVMMPKTDYLGISAKITDEDTKERLINILEEIKPNDCGFIIRTAALDANKEELLKEIQDLQKRWQHIEKIYEVAVCCSIVHTEEDLISRSIRDMMTSDVEKLIINDKDVYNQLIEVNCVSGCQTELYSGNMDMMTFYGLTPQIERLTKKKVVMKNGSSIIIDKVEALTVIDVNTGKFVGNKNEHLEDTVFTTNMLASEEIAKQLRLRNIGGIIIVDFIDMELQSNRDRVLEYFGEQLKKDRIKTTLVGMTNLGLVELTRKKMRSSISAYMLQQCPYCYGDGYIHSDEYIISKLKDSLLELFAEIDPDVVLIRVNPSVFKKIDKFDYFVNECQEIWQGKKLYIVPDNSLHIEKYCIDIDRDILNNIPKDAKLICL